jgi:hypothetical protein
MRTSKGYLFRACYSTGVSHCVLAETQSQAEEQKHFTVEKGKAFKHALIRGDWCAEDVGGQTSNKKPYVVG